MVNIRQSKEYALFMEKLGWKAEEIPNYVYVREFPIIGSFIKILRIKSPIPFKEIEKIAKKYRAFKVQIEAEERLNKSYTSYKSYKTYDYRSAKTSFAPTKTIMIDLKPTGEQIFNSFSPEKRRAVRRAEKNGIIIKEADDINEFIKLKNQQLWPFSLLLCGEIKALWEVFARKGNATLLLAFTPPGCERCETEKPIGGVLLLFYDKVAYYWLASATSEGKKLFAPSLLVWEALKMSKQKGCTIFDFEGIEDKRFPETKNWRGFSRFKSGFGGKEVVYANPIQKLFWPIR